MAFQCTYLTTAERKVLQMKPQNTCLSMPSTQHGISEQMSQDGNCSKSLLKINQFYDVIMLCIRLVMFRQIGLWLQ